MNGVGDSTTTLMLLDNAVVTLMVWVTVSGRPGVVVALEPSTLTTEYCAARTSSGLRCSTLTGKASVYEMSERKLKTESVDGDIVSLDVNLSSEGCKDCFDVEPEARFETRGGKTIERISGICPEERVGDEARSPVHQAPVYIFVLPWWRGRLES
jgi:hypothetical protein